MSDNDKKRFSVTLTPAYIEALNLLVKDGIYLDDQDTIRDALRLLFRYHRIKPFLPLVEEAREPSP